MSVSEVPALAVHSPAEQVLCASHTDVSTSAVVTLGANDRYRQLLQAVHCVSLLLVPASDRATSAEIYFVKANILRYLTLGAFNV